MTRATLWRLLGRYAVPCAVRSLYYAVRFRCLVSLRADVQLSSRIRLGRGSDIRPYARIINGTGSIILGRRCGISSFTYLANGSAFIRIGDGVRIGPHVYLGSSNRGFEDPNTPILDQEKSEQGIVIEDDVWVGAHVVVLDGVRIGRGSVIGAGAIVTRDIPPLSIAVGNPARVIRQRGDRPQVRAGRPAEQVLR
ncbi:MAG: acyltransferase [Candidatus Omnitrophica bacterium]|nr:acyltransferase [Candidatus Omnitrophota bacterium]